MFRDDQIFPNPLLQPYFFGPAVALPLSLLLTSSTLGVVMVVLGTLLLHALVAISMRVLWIQR